MTKQQSSGVNLEQGDKTLHQSNAGPATDPAQLCPDSHLRCHTEVWVNRQTHNDHSSRYTTLKGLKQLTVNLYPCYQTFFSLKFSWKEWLDKTITFKSSSDPWDLFSQDSMKQLNLKVTAS